MVQTVWVLTGLGRKGESTLLKFHPIGSQLRHYRDFSGYAKTPGVDIYDQVFLGALFVRRSVSGVSPPEAVERLLATGCDIKPQLEVSFSDATNTTSARAQAKATYSFPGLAVTLDVTERVAWQSDNPSAIEVSNLTGSHFPSGSLLTTRAGSANITASLLTDVSQAGTPSGYATTSGRYTSAFGAQIRNIAITPRNQILTSAGRPAVHFYCTAFAGSALPQDCPTHLVRDVTGDPALEWTLRDPSGQVVAADRATVAGGVLNILDSRLPSGVYTVEARLSGGDLVVPGQVFTNQAKLEIQLP